MILQYGDKNPDLMSLGQNTGQTNALFNSFVGALNLFACAFSDSFPFVYKVLTLKHTRYHFHITMIVM